MKKLKSQKNWEFSRQYFPKDWEVHDGELLSYTVDKKKSSSNYRLEQK